MAEGSKLTARERRFVELRATGLNGADTLRAMGFKGPRPDHEASKLSTRPRVKAALEAKLQQLAGKLGVTQEQWFAEVWSVASHKVRKITGSDKNKALELAGRALGAFKDTAGERDVIGPGLTIIVNQVAQVAGAAPVAQSTRIDLMPGPER